MLCTLCTPDQNRCLNASLHQMTDTLQPASQVLCTMCTRDRAIGWNVTLLQITALKCKYVFICIVPCVLLLRLDARIPHCLKWHRHIATRYSVFVCPVYSCWKHMPKYPHATLMQLNFHLLSALCTISDAVCPAYTCSNWCWNTPLVEWHRHRFIRFSVAVLYTSTTQRCSLIVSSFCSLLLSSKLLCTMCTPAQNRSGNTLHYQSILNCLYPWLLLLCIQSVMCHCFSDLTIVQCLTTQWIMCTLCTPWGCATSQTAKLNF